MPQPDSGMYYWSRALALADSSLSGKPDSRYMRYAKANVLNFIAAYHTHQGDVHKGTMFLQQALDIREAIGDSAGLAQSYNNLASAQYRSGRIREAVDLLYKSLQISTASRDSNAMAYNQHNIGQLLLASNDPEGAYKAFNSSLTIRRRIGEQQAVLESLTGLALYHRKAGEPEQAIPLLQEALILGMGFGDSLGVSHTLEGLAHTMEMLDSLPQALQFQTRALSIDLHLGLRDEASNKMMNIAGYQLRMGSSNEALSNALRGVAIAEQTGAIKNLVNGFALLSKIHRVRSNYRSAYNYRTKHAQLKDSLFYLNDQQHIIKTSIRFDQQQVEYADSLSRASESTHLRNENTIAHLTTNNNQNITRDLAAASIIMLIIGVVIFIIDRRRRNHRHARKAAHLQTQAWRAQVNPHFIHTALQNINAYVRSNERDLASSFLTRFARLMRAVLENARKEEVSLLSDLDVLRDYLELEKARLQDKFTYSIDVDPSIDQEEVHVPPMLLQPFAEEAIWQGFAQGKHTGHITIVVRQVAGSILISIQDDGGARSEPSNTSSNDIVETHVGTTITRARLDLLARQERKPATVRTITLPQGHRVELEIPLLTAA